MVADSLPLVTRKPSRSMTHDRLASFSVTHFVSMLIRSTVKLALTSPSGVTWILSAGIWKCLPSGITESVWIQPLVEPSLAIVMLPDSSIDSSLGLSFLRFLWVSLALTSSAPLNAPLS